MVYIQSLTHFCKGASNEQTPDFQPASGSAEHGPFGRVGKGVLRNNCFSGWWQIVEENFDGNILITYAKIARKDNDFIIMLRYRYIGDQFSEYVNPSGEQNDNDIGAQGSFLQ